MTHSSANAVLGGMLLVGMLSWVWLAAMAILVPFAILSAVRSLKRIHVQAERIAEVLESRGRTSGGGLLGL